MLLFYKIWDETDIFTNSYFNPNKLGLLVKIYLIGHFKS